MLQTKGGGGLLVLSAFLGELAPSNQIRTKKLDLSLIGAGIIFPGVAGKKQLLYDALAI